MQGGIGVASVVSPRTSPLNVRLGKNNDISDRHSAVQHVSTDLRQRNHPEFPEIHRWHYTFATLVSTWKEGAYRNVA